MTRNAMLILIFGLPGTGKTTLAAALANQMGALHLNTDIIRHELGMLGQYDEGSKRHIYEEMFRRAGEALHVGETVIIDGTFYKRSYRKRVQELAERKECPFVLIEVTADVELVRERVSSKRKYSEADFSVYRKIREEFEPEEAPHLVLESGRDNLTDILNRALEYVRL